MTTRFKDRRDAGRQLAAKLVIYANRPDVLVLALPRGGVPVAFEVAKTLHAPLDVLLVRKLGVPGHEELAMGAIASGGIQVLNREVITELGLPRYMLEAVLAVERQELARRERLYRGEQPAPEIRGQTVILVDDGLATGSTMQAAVAALRQQAPAAIVVAVPVAQRSLSESFRRQVDDLICVLTPPLLHAVGPWYQDFSQTSDEEVRDLLRRAARRAPAVGSSKS